MNVELFKVKNKGLDENWIVEVKNKEFNEYWIV